jgi:hypothetical protein
VWHRDFVVSLASPDQSDRARAQAIGLAFESVKASVPYA